MFFVPLLLAALSMAATQETDFISTSLCCIWPWSTGDLCSHFTAGIIHGSQYA